MQQQQKQQQHVVDKIRKLTLLSFRSNLCIASWWWWWFMQLCCISMINATVAGWVKHSGPQWGTSQNHWKLLWLLQLALPGALIAVPITTDPAQHHPPDAYFRSQQFSITSQHWVYMDSRLHRYAKTQLNRHSDIDNSYVISLLFGQLR